MSSEEAGRPAASGGGAGREGAKPEAPSTSDWISYDFAVLRVVPHVHLGAFTPVGVVLHARTANFLGLRVLTDDAALRALAPAVDTELLARYLRSCKAIAEGDPAAGPIALAPSSERFHWLTAPRSDVIQPSPIHSGLAPDPVRELEGLFGKYVGGGVEREQKADSRKQ